MRAVILAGGRGTRLAPYTHVIPKPLLPVGETPILEIVIRQLVAAGFQHITLTLGYMAPYFRAYLDQSPELRRLATIDCVEEPSPTGTAGSLASVVGLDHPFLVMNGDLLTNLDYRALMASHLESQAALTIAVHRKQVPIDLGVVDLAPDGGTVCGYTEKPTLQYTVSMGIYAYDPSVLDEIERDEYLDFPDLVLRLVERGRTVRAFANTAEWLDLGRHEDFERAQELLETRGESFFLRSAS